MDSLIVFARAPVANQTKTRLAHAIGAHNSTAIAAAMLRDTLDTARMWAKRKATTREVCVAFSPADAFAVDKFGAPPCSLSHFWDGARFAQSEGDIGARMLAAILRQQARGCKRVLLIGSDVPEISLEILDAVLGALETHDLAFGAAHDGGFYLLGTACALPPELFQNVEWSCPQTLFQAIEGARRGGLSCALGAALHDIDDFAALLALRERLTHAPDSAPHTRRALNGLQHVFENAH